MPLQSRLWDFERPEMVQQLCQSVKNRRSGYFQSISTHCSVDPPAQSRHFFDPKSLLRTVNLNPTIPLEGMYMTGALPEEVYGFPRRGPSCNPMTAYTTSGYTRKATEQAPVPQPEDAGIHTTGTGSQPETAGIRTTGTCTRAPLMG